MPWSSSSVALVLTVAVCGLAVLVLVILLRVLPLIHKPRVTVRPKPFPGVSTRVSSVPSVPAETASFSAAVHAADRSELLQARSRWEKLIEEALSNEELTTEQRESFVEEGRKRIAEISKQLEELS